MRYIKLYVIALVSVFSSCSNKLDLIDPVDPIPVVYFQMDLRDSVFYLTLTKSFSGESSAFDLARDAGRVFYDSADIRLEGWTDEFKVTEIRFKRSERIKNPGIFPEVPGYCYEAVNESFKAENETINSYRLVIDIPGIANPIVSRISVLPQSGVPNRYNHVIGLYPDGFRYPPKNNSVSSLKNIEMNNGFSTVAYQQLICEFHYQEYSETWVDHSVTFTLRQNTFYVEPILYGDFFFNKLVNNIKPISSTITRKFISLDLIFLSGDQYYKDYFESYQHDGNQDVPLKGNIINGYGLFTMKSEARYKDMTFDQRTLDSLSMGTITRKLKFVRW